MSFQINDKVVCVDAAPSRNCLFPSSALKKGSIYVVEGLDLEEDMQGDIGLHLVGVSSFLHPRGIWLGWNSRRFRKLSEVQAENTLRAQQPEPALA